MAYPCIICMIHNLSSLVAYMYIVYVTQMISDPILLHPSFMCAAEMTRVEPGDETSMSSSLLAILYSEYCRLGDVGMYMYNSS